MLLRSCLSRYITISTMRTFTGKNRHIALPARHAFLSSLNYFVKNPQRPNQARWSDRRPVVRSILWTSSPR